MASTIGNHVDHSGTLFTVLKEAEKEKSESEKPKLADRSIGILSDIISGVGFGSRAKPLLLI